MENRKEILDAEVRMLIERAKNADFGISPARAYELASEWDVPIFNPVKFTFGLYRNEAYGIIVPAGETSGYGTQFWKALFQRDKIVIDFAIAYLFHRKSPELFRKHMNPEQAEEAPVYDFVPGGVDRSFAEVLTKDRCFLNEVPRVENAMAENWVSANSSRSHFVDFTDVYACFIAGWCSRGAQSKANQRPKLNAACVKFSGYGGVTPDSVELDFLNTNKNTPYQEKCAAGVATYLMSTALRDRLAVVITHAIVRPCCKAGNTLYRRYREFNDHFPSWVFSEKFPLVRVPSIQAALTALSKILELIHESKTERRETEIFTARTINLGTFHFLNDIQVKKGASLLFFAVCHLKGQRGKSDWDNYLRNDWARRIADPCYLNFIAAWVDKVKQDKTLLGNGERGK